MNSEPLLKVVFFKTLSGNEPVRVWLKTLPVEARKAIGVDIKTIQFGWPMGLPLVRKFEPGLWEVRTNLKDGIARVFFSVEGNTIVLLHGFVKKAQKTPQAELNLARRRLAQLRGPR